MFNPWLILAAIILPTAAVTGGLYFILKVNRISARLIYPAVAMFSFTLIVGASWLAATTLIPETISMPRESACSEAADCVVPFELAIRSDCPYEAHYSDGECRVVCPFEQWAKLVAAIEACQVKVVFQKHDLAVTAELKTGEKLFAREPVIDAVFDLLSKVSARCGKVIMATE